MPSKRSVRRAAHRQTLREIATAEIDALQRLKSHHNAAPADSLSSSLSDSIIPQFPSSDVYNSVFERFQARENAAKERMYQKQSEQENQAEAEAEEIDQSPSAHLAAPHSVSSRSPALSLALLKSLADRPDLVDPSDVNSSDPILLLRLKSWRVAVSVPGHWSAKRKYLAMKRGLVKPPWQLPPFIAATGIGEMRSAALAKEGEKSSKRQMREKIRPKSGGLEIDYQTLHDAFFVHQRKPPLSEPGELYFEGKENEQKRFHFLPGRLSDRLREALGMKFAHSPPPWLAQQQRIGPPPAYPNIRIAGVNAPIPKGAKWGFGPEEWGAPNQSNWTQNSEEEIETEKAKLWGEIELPEAPAAEEATSFKLDRANEHFSGNEDDNEEEDAALAVNHKVDDVNQPQGQGHFDSAPPVAASFSVSGSEVPVDLSISPDSLPSLSATAIRQHFEAEQKKRSKTEHKKDKAKSDQILKQQFKF